MFWKYCLIALFLVLQPLRGFAEAQAVFCGIGGSAGHAVDPHAHHHRMAAAHLADPAQTKKPATAMPHDHSDLDQHQHGKSCAACCQVCGPALSALSVQGDRIIPAAPDRHRIERAPPSPVDDRIRPPIA